MSAAGIPLSVLDLAAGRARVDAGRCPAELHRPRPARGTARLPPALGRRAPQHARHRQLVTAGAARAPRGGDVDDPGRVGRGHAPEPLAARRGRAVRDARGAPPRAASTSASAGRPGTDPVTAHALRRGAARLRSPTTSPSSSRELLAYFDGTFPEDHPYSRITAVPARGYRPAVWLLGLEHLQRTRRRRARDAVLVRVPLRAGDARRRARRVPRRVPAVAEHLQQPYVMLGVSVICAETDERARWLASPGALAFLRLRQGRPDVYPTPGGGGRVPVHAGRARAA